MKTCSKCGLAFAPGKGTKGNRCAACRTHQQQQRRAAERLEREASRRCLKCGGDLPPPSRVGAPKRSCDKCLHRSRREYLVTHVGKRRNWNRKSDWKKQGIVFTVEDYERISRLQGGRCAICRANRSAIDKKNLCVDHDHDFGHVRGLLCVACNRGIGALKHSPAILRAAAKYLELHQPKLKLVSK